MEAQLTEESPHKMIKPTEIPQLSKNLKWENILQ